MTKEEWNLILDKSQNLDYGRSMDAPMTLPSGSCWQGFYVYPNGLYSAFQAYSYRDGD